MQNYTNWLKNCIDGIKNANLADISGYGQALYWQFMFLGTIILTLIIIAAVFFILGVGPFLYIKKQKQCYIADIKLVQQKLCGVKKVNFGNGRNFVVQIDLFSDKKEAIAKRYIKRCSRFVAIIFTILAFLMFPLFLEFNDKITIPSLIGGVTVTFIIFSAIVDFFWFIITLCTGTSDAYHISIFDLVFQEIEIPSKDNFSGDIAHSYIFDNFIVRIFDVSDNFTESVLCEAMDNCRSNLELNDKSFENNIDNFYTWMNKFVMPEYKSLIKHGKEKDK